MVVMKPMQEELSTTVRTCDVTKNILLFFQKIYSE